MGLWAIFSFAFSSPMEIFRESPGESQQGKMRLWKSVTCEKESL
jgi:hypothetical protein